MLKRHWLASSWLAVGLASVTLPAAAGISVRIGPPEPKVVTPPPAPRSGYVWVPGYWDYRGNDYVWVDGHWEAERSGYRWRERRWIERDGGWYSEGGDWEVVPPPPR